MSALSAVRRDAQTGETIEEARDEILQLLSWIFHIKDALKTEAAFLGLDKKNIEIAITGDPSLALTGDLANLVKHYGPPRKPLSGSAPSIGDASSESTGHGWVLKLPIHHAGKTLDASDLARDSVNAWRRILSGWGLI